MVRRVSGGKKGRRITKKKRPSSKRRKGGTRKQKGGATPIQVDFKKGFTALKGIAKKEVWDFKGQDRRAKRQHAIDKERWRRFGTDKNFGDWMIATGQVKKVGASQCCIM